MSKANLGNPERAECIESSPHPDPLAGEGEGRIGYGNKAYYLPVLDGLRAVSILLVVFSHCGMGMEKIFPGTLGVVIFFVISGFLITRQMITEIEKTGSFNIRRFYLRRVLRLFPALLFYLAIFIPVLLYLGARITVPQFLSGILGFANYYHIFIGYPAYNPMPILWSLSVEEHYYMLFPFIMLLFSKKLSAALPLLLLIMLTALVWRAALYNACVEHASPVCGLPDKIRTQCTDAVFDCIMYGAFIALAFHCYYEKTCHILINNKALMLSLMILLLSLAIRNTEFRASLRYSLQAGSSAVIMINLLLGEPGRIQKLLTSGWLIFIGRLSYSLYLTHFGVLITIEATQGSRHLNNIRDVFRHNSQKGVGDLRVDEKEIDHFVTPVFLQSPMQTYFGFPVGERAITTVGGIGNVQI